jgi:heme exporter protein D
MSMSLGPHAAFIIAAYAATVMVVGALVAWVTVDHSIQKRLLGELDRKGVTRRSAATVKEPA